MYTMYTKEELITAYTTARGTPPEAHLIELFGIIEEWTAQSYLDGYNAGKAATA